MDDRGLHKARAIVDVLESKKGEDILLLDLVGECSFTDFFVICTGPSERTLRALSEEVQKKMKDEYGGPYQPTEGDAASGWILLDYGDVVLHLFSDSVRDYYALEELWEGGRIVVRLQ